MTNRNDAFVIRWVITHVNSDGLRTLVSAAQGRNTYENSETAEKQLAAMRENNRLERYFPNPETLAVRPCECWPIHFDPKGVYFDE